MIYDPPPPPPPLPGPAPLPGSPPPRRSRATRIVLVGGATIGLALGGFGVASATSPTSNPAPRPAASTPAPKVRGPFGHAFAHGLRARGLALGLGGRVLHGQVTVQTAKGKYETVDFQAGKASDVSSTSITVTSADGYKHTYSVASSTIVDAQRNGISSIASGNQVRVTATVSGSKDTARSITDVTKLGAAGIAGGGMVPAGPPNGMPGRPGNSPST